MYILLSKKYREGWEPDSLPGSQKRSLLIPGVGRLVGPRRLETVSKNSLRKKLGYFWNVSFISIFGTLVVVY
jgi:hypothetical protein